MSCDLNTRFNKVDHIGSTLLNNQLETNLKSYVEWGLLNIGAWSNAPIYTTGAYGGTFDNMRPVNDPAYTDGQVWETPRKDWVWETGICYTGLTSTGSSTGVSPISISGVYLNGSFVSTGDATYGHHFNYPLGRVIFDTAIDQDSVVQVAHSYRNVQVYIADDAPWMYEIQHGSYRVDDSTFSQAGSGNWGIFGNHRVQLPAIVIEAIPRRTATPYELGSLTSFTYQDVMFYVIADSRAWRNQLIDVIALQHGTTVRLFDNDTIVQSGVYPLDYRGMPVSSPLNYSDLVTLYPDDKTIFFKDISVTDMATVNPRLYAGKIKVTFETLT